MARPRPPAGPRAVTLAERLRAGLRGDPDFAPDDLPAETPGVSEPGALFHLADAHGRRWRVRVNRV